MKKEVLASLAEDVLFYQEMIEARQEQFLINPVQLPGLLTQAKDNHYQALKAYFAFSNKKR